MRTLLIICAAAAMVFLFAAGAAAEAVQEPAPAAGVPPVAQQLVREGDFAIRLAGVYELGNPESETEAEDLLAHAGVVPTNGWLADYPVTPEILGQLQEAAVKAASEGTLKLSGTEATRRLTKLAGEMGLPVPAGTETGTPGPAAPEPDINGYYEGYGPPIITYYPPPSAYLYLYAWVPYPFWWYGYWYPGFYICNNFTTTIVVGSRRVIVRNRFVDPATRRIVRVEPVVRTGRGLRAGTVLRTEEGRTVRTFRQLRREPASGGIYRGDRHMRVKRPPVARGYQTPRERRSAGQIYQRSLERQRDWRNRRDHEREDRGFGERGRNPRASGRGGYPVPQQNWR